MIYTDEMGEADRMLLAAWMNERIRKSGVAEPFPEAIIPRTGLAVRNENDRTLAVCALYLERSSKIAVCGWCVADPAMPRCVTGRAVKLVLSAMPVYAKRCGAEYLMSVFGQRSINLLLDKSGFVNGDQAETKIRRL